MGLIEPEPAEADLVGEARAYVSAAAGKISAGWDPSYPTALDYLTWADACTVHWPTLPLRASIRRLLDAALRQASDGGCESRGDSGPDALGAALSVLAQDAQAGYPGVRHVMEFPSAAGFSSASALQSGDVFLRAIVLETLAGAHRHGLLSCERALQDGVHYLMRARTRLGGGWSYFPGLVELAPDADTLAQIARVFAACGRTDLIEQYIIPMLERIDDSPEPLETWLYSDDAATGSLQRFWAKSAWGTGTDPEVVANLADAIERVAPQRFAPLLERMRAALVQAAVDDTWMSTWYHGSYYGTFVCVRALAGYTQAQPLLGRTLERLRFMQLPDGGWGLAQTGDPLNTSFALLSLLRAGVSPGDDAVRRGREFLEWRARQGTLTEAVPFIRMNVGRVRNEAGPILSFAGEPLTAAYVVQALVSCEAGPNAFS